VRIEHIEVKGPLSQIPYPLGDFHPCARVMISGGVLEVKFPGPGYIRKM
jgi:hypothetical protein